MPFIVVTILWLVLYKTCQMTTFAFAFGLGVIAFGYMLSEERHYGR